MGEFEEVRNKSLIETISEEDQKKVQAKKDDNNPDLGKDNNQWLHGSKHGTYHGFNEEIKKHVDQHKKGTFD
jgi:hypothetical protein